MSRTVFASLVVAVSAKTFSVLVFGDSYGDTGPTWRQVDDMFTTRGYEVDVQSSAVGGTSSCHWAGLDNGQQLVIQAQKAFPNLPDGPDFVWFTMGANDNWQDSEFSKCQKSAKDFAAFDACAKDFNTRVSACSETLLENYWKVFPNSKVMQSGYDVPCDSAICRASFDRAFYGGFCGTNMTCANIAGIHWEDMYLDGLQSKYPQPRYTTLKMVGTVQKAWGLDGADTGKPVLDQGANCKWESWCVHPSYNSPAGIAWGDAFWNLYFSKQVSDSLV